MIFVAFYICLFLSTLCLATAWFETAIGVSLIVPIVAFGLGVTSPAGYLLCFAVAVGIGLICCGVRTRWPSHLEWGAVFAFLVLYSYLLLLAHQWGDFTATAERPRDIAVLGATFRNPLIIEEPWFSGNNLNYYAYWYRYGRMLGVLVGENARFTYHALIAFPLALLSVATFQLLTYVFKIKKSPSLLIAFITTFGSNIDGMIWFFKPFESWWSPSRVVKGGINEFPAWSFILGDAHPHFLSVGVCPLFLTIGGMILSSTCTSFDRKVVLALVVMTLTTLFYAHANPWDVPLWLVVGGLLLGSFLYKAYRENPITCTSAGTLTRLKLPVVLISTFFLAMWLIQSIKQVSPSGDYPIRLIGEGIHLTTVKELLLHFGVPLGALSLALLSAIRSNYHRFLIVALLACASCSSQALPLLILILFISGIVAVIKYREAESCGPLLLAIAGIIIVGICEVIFLDDPYGGENERMNTLFKMHNYAWTPLIIGGLTCLVVFTQKASPVGKTFSWLCLILLLSSSAFFIKSAFVLRPTRSGGISDGLEKLDIDYPGARGAINFLQVLPRKVVLEAQGDAYTLATHIASLSGQPSFLGWQNHVNLFSRRYEEIQRRATMTDEIYKSDNCEDRRQKLRSEDISIVVVGPLEVQRYGQVSKMDCLAKIFSDKNYTLYSPFSTVEFSSASENTS